MSQTAMFAWRHLAHVAVGMLVAWLTARYGLNVNQPFADWVDGALFAAGVAAYGWVQHWLETRSGRGWKVIARAIARAMVLGAPGTPVYAKRSTL